MILRGQLRGKVRRRLDKILRIRPRGNSEAFSFSAYLMASRCNASLIDRRSFRQTQTAISVRAMLDGGPWLAYETPVLGQPWSIPFEFPTYQWLVALTELATHLPIDQAGRVVSVVP